MKKTILVLSLAFAVPAASAAEPVVQIVSPAEVRLDGLNAGQVSDVMANYPKLRPVLQARLAEWHAAREVEKQQALDARTKADAAAAALAKQLAEAQAARAGENQKAADAEKAAGEKSTALTKQLTEAQAAREQAKQLGKQLEERSAVLAKQLAEAQAAREAGAKAIALLAVLQAADPATLPPAVGKALAEVLQSEEERELAQLAARKASIESRRKERSEKPAPKK